MVVRLLIGKLMQLRKVTVLMHSGKMPGLGGLGCMVLENRGVEQWGNSRVRGRVEDKVGGRVKDKEAENGYTRVLGDRWLM